LLTRKYDVGYKKITAAVLLDRFSGLLALGIDTFGLRSNSFRQAAL
jgi:hypothetical protein